MPVSRRAPACLAALVAALLLGSCATSGTPIRPRYTADGTILITAEQIRGSRATDAWDVLRISNRHLRLRGGGLRGEARVSRRGSTSIVLDDALWIVVDGVRVPDAEALRSIPASIIGSIRILSGARATEVFGTGAGGGAVVVTSAAPGH